ncbi:50S ribosomal protein L19 [Blattabacterium punctulatus]|uniref:50S ribosomal protein L19 n=1 Tax=Blattabacterium punctulatus TaxID=164514 RepID=A0ABM6WMB7_9FLAO|nr:50S ribosomal protein L19 [Blattabacterium punctulatus]AWU39725.1 50S ribosomal protein L19 [Blattabacterium punctulatus]AWU40270.1 50S ribosomal protein L19 [Blattabacterium punctulatus]AWU44721.1 50S ribosomal protein L19 [Blattabacterium punctulatus]AWU45266.1 50S ribosomal protein L19 [Blattabacterium punctulatus]
MSNNFIENIEDKWIKKNDLPLFNSGDTISVFFEIKEGEKKRIQSFKGVVIKKQGKGLTKTFTVRKMSGEIGIERIFIFNQPSIKKIEVNKKGKVRRSKIYYFRSLRGKKARV